jgi:hypothetical protein
MDAFFPSYAWVPLVGRPLLLWCKDFDQPMSCLCPLMGSQHPSGGLFSPMEVRTDHLPMCTGPNGTCPLGMVLHTKSYALHGLISPWQCQSHFIINIIKHMHKIPNTSINSSKMLHKPVIQVWGKGQGFLLV